MPTELAERWRSIEQTSGGRILAGQLDDESSRCELLVAECEALHQQANELIKQNQVRSGFAL
jgi:hypothetical protein